MRMMLIRAAARLLRPVVEEIERRRGGSSPAEIRVKLTIEGAEDVRAKLEALGAEAARQGG